MSDDDGRGTATARGAAGAEARRVGEAVLRLADGLTRVIAAAAADEGLSPAEARLLRALGDRRPQGLVAAGLATTPSRVSVLTRGLEARGLVRRDPSRGDRRVRELQVTAAGAAAVGRIGARLAAASPLLHALDDDERAALLALLEKAEAALPAPTAREGPDRHAPNR